MQRKPCTIAGATGGSTASGYRAISVRGPQRARSAFGGWRTHSGYVRAHCAYFGPAAHRRHGKHGISEKRRGHVAGITGGECCTSCTHDRAALRTEYVRQRKRLMQTLRLSNPGGDCSVGRGIRGDCAGTEKSGLPDGRPLLLRYVRCGRVQQACPCLGHSSASLIRSASVNEFSFSYMALAASFQMVLVRQ